MADTRRTIYIMAEEGNDAYCKIGKDSSWPFRFKQAHSHNPNRLKVVAAWHFMGIANTDIIAMESHVQGGLPGLQGAIVSEWYAVNPKAAVEIVSERLRRKPDETSSPIVPVYNDWGEPNCTKNGETYKSRIWLYSEDILGGRVKISHGILFDTNYKYNFTYNPRPVYLRYALELPECFGGPSPKLKVNNVRIQQLWEQATTKFGTGPDSHTLGWLNKEVGLEEVIVFFSNNGLVQYDLTSPKPADARPKDPSVVAIEYGKVPPQYRVRQCCTNGLVT